MLMRITMLFGGSRKCLLRRNGYGYFQTSNRRVSDMSRFFATRYEFSRGYNSFDYLRMYARDNMASDCRFSLRK